MKYIIAALSILVLGCSEKDITMPPEVDLKADNSPVAVSEVGLGKNGCRLDKVHFASVEDAFDLRCSEVEDDIAKFNQRMSILKYKYMNENCIDISTCERQIGNSRTVRLLAAKREAISSYIHERSNFSYISDSALGLALSDLLSLAMATNIFIYIHEQTVSVDCGLRRESDLEGVEKYISDIESKYNLKLVADVIFKIREGLSVQ